MNNLPDTIWIELRKAIRSKMPLWTTLASLFMPVGTAFLIFVAKHPEIFQKLGLVSAKANLLTYSATKWPSYLVLFDQIISAGGFFFFVIAISWVFGREFADGTLKDMLAVPVARLSILIAKFIVAIAWCAAMGIIRDIFGLVIGAVLRLPGGSPDVILHGALVTAITVGLTIGVVIPFALFASLGRGYLLPVGLAVLTVITANLITVLGWAGYFPWAVPILFSQGESSLTPLSYWILFSTTALGMIATYLWWMFADQNR